MPLQHIGGMIRHGGFPLKKASPGIRGWTYVRQMFRARLCGISLLTGDGSSGESIGEGTIPLGEISCLKGIMSWPTRRNR